MPAEDPADFRPPRSARSRGWPWLIALLIVLAAGWWFWWRPAHLTTAAPENTAAAPSEATGPSGAPGTAPADAAPPASAAGTVSGPVTEGEEANAHPNAPESPIDTGSESAASAVSPAEADRQVTQALNGLLGSKKVADSVLTDGVVRRVVATVDNFGRSYAPARLWPVPPTPGRFTVTDPGAAQTTIAPSNFARYDALVTLAESLPVDATAQLYARLYPLFQSAYAELGFPGHSFNDRLLAVLDLLIATPVPSEPITVDLTRVNGELPTQRPWVRYEYADPQLQALTSGQKILVRMGPENERRLQAVMVRLRAHLAAAASTQPAAH